MHHPVIPSSARQRGAAALVVTLLLFLAMALATLAVNRNLVFEQRASANQARATQAFEAAEAGAEWAIAQLNNTQALGADCTPSTDAAATRFRDRTLSLDRGTGRIDPTPAQPVCVRGASGWQCSCPASGSAAPGAATGSAPAPAFALQFLPADAAGAVRVTVNGCTSLAGACLPGASTTPDASAHVDLALALFAGMRMPPSTAVTARDTSAPGLDTNRFFATFFGVDKPTWQRQPVVARIACGVDCASAVAAAIGAGNALIWVDGELTLTGPATLGTAARPVAIVATGQVRLDSDVAVVGAVYGASLVWNGGGVQGAAISESSFTGTPNARVDADVLAALAHQTGSFVRVSGSWRDF
jgi:Tfp pilus assembly protein PilX